MWSYQRYQGFTEVQSAEEVGCAGDLCLFSEWRRTVVFVGHPSVVHQYIQSPMGLFQMLSERPDTANISDVQLVIAQFRTLLDGGQLGVELGNGLCPQLHISG